jgi:sigma-54 specific flagellar transcriptional regulator A
MKSSINAVKQNYLLWPKQDRRVKDNRSQERRRNYRRIDECNGVVAHAAKLLNMRRTTLVEKLKKFDL